MKAILVGFMGSGKTTVGRLLANQMKAPYHDLDEVIVQRAGKPIQQIFDEDGEDAFRLLEHEMLLSSLNDGGILSTGGGTPIQPTNFELLKQTSVPVILLDVLPETIMKRLQGDNARPLVKKLGLNGLMQLKQQRDPRYNEVSDLRIVTDNLTPVQVATIILENLPVRDLL